MPDRLRFRLAGCLAGALFLAACSTGTHDAKRSPAPTEAPTVRRGGTVTVAVDQEPATFNPRTLRGNTQATRDVVRSVLPSVWSINDRYEFVLNTDVVTSADVTQNDPQTIVYRIDPRAVWSDGVPVSADDFAFAVEMQKAGATDIDGKPISAVATLEDVIASVTGSDGGKTVTVVLKQPFADWKGLFNSPLVAAHQAKRVGWNTGFDTGDTMLSAGPFRIASHNRGKDLTLVRNERFWGTEANLDSIVFRFISQSTDTFDALRNREVDVITPRIQVDLKDQLAGIPGVQTTIYASQVYEYLDFKLTHPLLANPAVRQAFALALDRRAIVTRTLGQLYGKGDAQPPVLNHRLILTNQPGYLDTSGGRYDKRDVAEARRVLEGAGFSPGDDGVYARRADGARLSLRLTTTTGDELRETQEVLIQAEAREAGIEVVFDNVPPAQLAAKLLADGSDPKIRPFEIANVGQTILFASGASAVFGSGAAQNVTKYSSPYVDERFARARAELDAAQRTKLYNEIDAKLWEEMPRLPLYQRPGLVAYRDNVVNIAPSPALGPFWNTARWGLKP